MFAFEKTAEKVAKDLIQAIFRAGYYVQFRCPEENDLLNTPTINESKALNDIFCMDMVFVEAVSIDPENMKRDIVARYLFIAENTGPDCIADYGMNPIAEKIYRRAIA
jgi:hypothetical protein